MPAKFKLLSKVYIFFSYLINLNTTGHQTRKDLENESPVKGEDQSFDLSRSESCINNAHNAAKRLGLNLEMLFRAADIESKGCVYVEEFRMFLSKLKLGLSPAEITKLLHMFDEDWTGSIKRDDYLLCLVAYGVNSEKPNDKVRNLSQESLLKFARILVDKRFSSEDAFKNIDVKKTGGFTAEQLSDFYKKITPGVSKKDRAALFFTMDFEQTGLIQKSKFIDLIEKATRVVNEKLSETDRGFSGSGSTVLASGSTQGTNPNEKNKFLAIIDKFEKKINGPFTKLLESLVVANKNPESGINFKQTKEAIETFGDFLTYEEKFLIFRNLDLNKNGNICFEDLVDCFVEFKKKDSNYEFFIINLAKNLQALNLQTEAYFNENDINVDSKMDVEEFIKKFSKIMNIFKEETKKIFECIVINKKKKILCGYELINLINSYRHDVEAASKAKPTKKDDMGQDDEERVGDQGTSMVLSPNLSKTKTLGTMKTLKDSQLKESELKKSPTKVQAKQLEDDDKKFNKLIDILKPKLEKNDFFEIDGKKYDTIFNNYLACLKRFYLFFN